LWHSSCFSKPTNAIQQFYLRLIDNKRVVNTGNDQKIKNMNNSDLKILIAEDDVLMIKILEFILKRSGLEIIGYSKGTFENIPVIVVSSLGEEEGTVVEAFNLGADDFVSKPFNPNELLLRVKRLFAKKNYSIKPKEISTTISA
jgi:two-component system, OmpR family, response regulator VicR